MEVIGVHQVGGNTITGQEGIGFTTSRRRNQCIGILDIGAKGHLQVIGEVLLAGMRDRLQVAGSDKGK